MDAIEHTASPYHFKAGDPDELIIPALHGTTRVLESVLAYGTNVKRVVITSSVAAVLETQATPRVFTEADWNNDSVVEVREKGIHVRARQFLLLNAPIAAVAMAASSVVLVGQVYIVHRDG